MATFKKLYTTSELLSLLNRGSLKPYYWSYDGDYTFYCVDNRHDYYIDNGYVCILSHRSNYYRLRNKLMCLPFGLSLDPRSKSRTTYLFTLYPNSVFLSEGSSDKLNQLNEDYDGKLIVNVVVI